MKRILFFVSLAAWLSFWHVKLTAGRERRVRILAINGVCVFFSFFFPFLLFEHFSRSNAHTHSNKDSVKTAMRKSRKETENAVRFTRFLDFRFEMFDLGRSFSLAQI